MAAHPVIHDSENREDDLEPYRRLIELQREVVRVARCQEQMRRGNEALRERISRELTESFRRNIPLRRRLRQTAVLLLKRLPRFKSAGDTFRRANNAQPGSC